MHWSEPVERLARAVLWLVLASIFVMVPIGLMKQHSAEEQLKEKVTDAQEKLAEALRPKDDGPARLSVKTLGSLIRAFYASRAEGLVWFTNVSPRSGVVCLTGLVTNPNTKQTSESLPSCEKVEPYEFVHMKLMFAGGEVAELCKGVDCSMGLKDAPDLQ